MVRSRADTSMAAPPSTNAGGTGPEAAQRHDRESPVFLVARQWVWRTHGPSTRAFGGARSCRGSDRDAARAAEGPAAEAEREAVAA